MTRYSAGDWCRPAPSVQRRRLGRTLGQAWRRYRWGLPNVSAAERRQARKSRAAELDKSPLAKISGAPTSSKIRADCAWSEYSSERMVRLATAKGHPRPNVESRSGL